jgi:hypothetical protein
MFGLGLCRSGLAEAGNAAWRGVHHGSAPGSAIFVASGLFYYKLT